jgi:hypothetical protein
MWDKKKTTDLDVEEARDKMNLIKKTVIEKEADLAMKKLQNLNDKFEENEEMEMEKRRRERSKKHRQT